MELIKYFTELGKTDVALAGGKGASLGEMTQAGIPVPPGFVLLANAFEHFIATTELAVEIDAILHTVNHEEMHTIEHASEKIKALILDADMPKDIEEEVKNCFKQLYVAYVAVRSSATSEDSASAAWAGQLDSYLNTTEETLLDNVKKCWASLFTPRAIFYRFEKQLHKEKISVAVVVQKMVDSESSGIAFSVHPVTQDYNQLIIEAGFGLGEAIVSGQITPDSYVVEKQPLMILEKKVHEQAKGLFRAEHGGNAWQQLGERGKEQVLKENEILELSRLIINIEQHYGFPVDVEWAREKGKFYIVQSRPITTLAGKQDQNKDKKIMVNLQSREHSLLYFYVWQKSNQEFSGNFFYTVKNILFINSGYGKTSVWYENKELEDIFDGCGRRATKDKHYVNYVKKEFYKYFNRLSDYIKEKRKIKNLKDLRDYYETYINWWSPMAVMYVLPESKTAPDNIRKKALKIRSETEKYSDENDSFFIKNFGKLFQKYRAIAHLLTPEEVFTSDKSFKKHQIDSIKQREKGYVLYNGELYALNKLDLLLKKNNLQLQKEKIEETGIIHGQIAYEGIVKGKVKIIHSKKELLAFHEGEILVTEMTSPTYVSYIKKAAAIITNEGGIMCHAAIVSRELKKPCIIGTKIATRILKDGDLVEVNATHGLVRILSGNNKVDLGDYHTYQRCFQWKGGGLPYLFSDIFMGHYKTLECLITLAHGIWTNFLPKKVVEKTLEDGKELISNTQAFESYRTAFEDYKKECSIFFERIIKKHDVSQEELKALLVYFSKLFYYYSKTEFFYVDKAFEYAKTHEDTSKNLEKFDAIKNKGREYLNNLFLGEKSYFEELLRIISEKFSVTTKDLKSYSGKELLDLFDKRKVSKETLEARRLAYVMLPSNGKIDTIYGKEAEDIITIFFQKAHDLQRHELRGVTANKGKVIGRVRIFSYGPEEFDKLKDMIHEMQKGEILVADTTSPELMMACKKAAAILTNQGGLMSHAAIVSRELGIPCIVGLGNITDVVTNGDEVEVDADKGLVTVLKREMSNKHFEELMHVDAPLSVAELTYFGETIKNIPWSQEPFAYHPYAVFVRKDGKLYYFIDKEGTAWKKQQAGKFDADNIIKKILPWWKQHKEIFTQEKALSREELVHFLGEVRDIWTWLDCMWWMIEYYDEHKLPVDQIMKVRKETEYFSPGLFAILRNTLKRLAPQKEKYVDVLLLNEFLNDKIPSNDLLEKRLREFAYTDGKLFTSIKEVENTYNLKLDLDIPKEHALKGQTAYPGNITGKVHIVATRRDIQDFQKGEVLVASTTTPDFLPAMKKAAAIISEHGGIICHAAITSRELKIPCLVGVKGATKILQNGMIVSVNTDQSIINILKN